MKVRIYQPHTHAGKRYTPGPEGIEIDLPEQDIAYLKQHRPDVLAKPKAEPTAAAETTKG